MSDMEKKDIEALRRMDRRMKPERGKPMNYWEKQAVKRQQVRQARPLIRQERKREVKRQRQEMRYIEAEEFRRIKRQQRIAKAKARAKRRATPMSVKVGRAPVRRYKPKYVKHHKKTKGKKRKKSTRKKKKQEIPFFLR